MSERNGLIEAALLKFTAGYPTDIKYTVVDLAVDSTVVSAVPAVLVGVYVNTALSAHTVAVADDVTTVYTIAASTGIGSLNLGNYGAGVRFETNLTITPNVASTGEIMVLWKEIT